MTNSLRIRQALRIAAGGGSAAMREKLLPLLDTFVRPPCFEHGIRMAAANDFAFDSERNLIVPPQAAFEWIILPKGNVRQGWDSCLERIEAEVDRYDPFANNGAGATVKVKEAHYNLLVSFEDVDEAFLFKARWVGATR